MAGVMDADDDSKVVVRRLPLDDMTQEQIEDYFRGFGNVLHMHFLEEDRAKTGEAHIHYETKEDAECCLRSWQDAEYLKSPPKRKLPRPLVNRRCVREPSSAVAGHDAALCAENNLGPPVNERTPSASSREGRRMPPKADEFAATAWDKPPQVEVLCIDDDESTPSAPSRESCRASPKPNEFAATSEKPPQVKERWTDASFYPWRRACEEPIDALVSTMGQQSSKVRVQEAAPNHNLSHDREKRLRVDPPPLPPPPSERPPPLPPPPPERRRPHVLRPSEDEPPPLERRRPCADAPPSHRESMLQRLCEDEPPPPERPRPRVDTPSLHMLLRTSEDAPPPVERRLPHGHRESMPQRPCEDKRPPLENPRQRVDAPPLHRESMLQRPRFDAPPFHSESMHQATSSTALQCAWCKAGQIERMLSHNLVGTIKPGQQRRWNQGAGVIALRGIRNFLSGLDNSRGSLHRAQVCLVSGKKGQLGFPKGGQKNMESSLQTARREWKEETGLTDDCLRFLGNEVLVEASFGVHYFVAEFRNDVGECPEGTWKPWEDPNDPDPILVAEWMAVDAALRRRDMSFGRKELLREATRVAERARMQEQYASFHVQPDAALTGVVASPCRKRPLNDDDDSGP